MHDIATKKPVKEVQGFWNTLGPGLTTGASDDDPSGIATYSQAGAQYGNQLVWLAGFTFPFMAVVQEMCARIGLVTGRGLAANIRRHYSRPVLMICVTLLFVANVFNIGVDLGAMAAATQLLIPSMNFLVLALFFTVISLLLQIFSTYERYAKYLKYLTLVLFSYILSAFLVHGLDWSAIGRAAFVPSFQNFSKEKLFLICAILGTTISPYLFFWQTSQEVEDEILSGNTTLAQRKGATREEIKKMRIDVWTGMFFSNAIMFFIIIACAGTLFTNGVTDIKTAADAARALRPLAGEASYLLFALGIIGTGLLAVPVLAGSTAYAVAETFRWRQGLFLKLNQAYAFYGILIISMLIGFSLNFFGIDPIKALIYSAIINGMIAPVILVLILSLSSDKKIMGRWANGPLTKVFGWGIALLMAFVAVATIAMFFV
ncbi:Nramp family divalent metal transporter [Candidatus Uhrbacteria bacterium]|nr:Nramp family divalent metal transporter [Candidatus Uhrbacteria bacterium]